MVNETHNRFTAGLEYVRDHPGEQVSEKQNHSGKANLHLLEQEIVSGSGISWVICKSAPRSRQHPTTQFLQAGCSSCHPTNSVKALW